MNARRDLLVLQNSHLPELEGQIRMMHKADDTIARPAGIIIQCLDTNMFVALAKPLIAVSSYTYSHGCLDIVDARANPLLRWNELLPGFLAYKIMVLQRN